MFAAKVLPIIEALRASGVLHLRGLAWAQNNCGVRTARGGRWHVSNVKNVVDRLPAVSGLFRREDRSNLISTYPRGRSSG